MVKLGFHYIWFKLALAMGSLLGLVLLVQSVRTYYRVSEGEVHAYLRREAERQLDALPREAFDAELDQAQLRSMLEELRQDAPSKIAWIRLLDSEGKATIQVGNPVGPPLKITQASEGRATTPGGNPADPPSKLAQAPPGRGGFGPPVPGAESRQTPEGRVRVEVMWFSRRFGGGWTGRFRAAQCQWRQGRSRRPRVRRQVTQDGRWSQGVILCGRLTLQRGKGDLPDSLEPWLGLNPGAENFRVSNPGSPAAPGNSGRGISKWRSISAAHRRCMALC